MCAIPTKLFGTHPPHQSFWEIKNYLSRGSDFADPSFLVITHMVPRWVNSLKLCILKTTRTPLLSWSNQCIQSHATKKAALQYASTLQSDMEQVPALTNLQPSIVLNIVFKKFQTEEKILTLPLQLNNSTIMQLSS